MDPVTNPPPLWQGTARAGRGLWGLLGVVGLVSVVLVAFSGGPLVDLALPISVLLVVAMWFSSMRVDVTRECVQVSSGLLAWPRSRIATGALVSATALEVRPMRWGGWGYRGSRRLFKRAAWIVRTGPGLVLAIDDGSTLTITVDGAPEAAAVLNRLITPPSG